MLPRPIARLIPTAVLAFALAQPAWADPPMRVAVLEFTNASSEAGLEALGKGLQSMVTTDLARVASLTLVERSRLQEIVAEQKLGNTGLLDKATAAKIGKLLGASHLLGGTFTIVAKSMRLDARLFSVKTGEVLLAEDMTGDRDAFFEIEKALLNKLIVTLGVKLEPKERAGIAKIHTADFAAFKIFSQGVALFDQQRYDEAMEALRGAVTLDVDFNLARVTLDEYQALVAKIRAKAQTIELTTRKLNQAKQDQDFDNDAKVAERLVAIASETDPAGVHRRLAALTYLIGFYDTHARNHGRIWRFQDHFDGLQVRRSVDGLARRYLAEAQPLFPKAPLFSTGQHPPDKPQDVDKRIDGLVGALKQGMEHQAANRNQGLINNLARSEAFLELMAADRRETAVVREQVVAKLAVVSAEANDKTRALQKLAEAYLDVGDVDAASGALARCSAIETDVGDLKQLATRIESLGQLSALLARTDKKAELRELIAGGERNPVSLGKLFADKGPPLPKLLAELAHRRETTRWWAHRDPFWMWSGEPAHLLQGEYVTWTGPRTDGLSTRELRYYHGQNMSAKDVLIAVGRMARSDCDVTLTLTYTRAPDFWPRHVPREVVSAGDLQLDPGRPEVTWLFGLHDVAVDSQQDPDTHKNFYATPTQAYGIRLTATGVALVRIGEDPPSPDLRKPEMSVQEIVVVKAAVTDNVVKVHLVVKGKAVTVTVGSATHRFTLPEAVAGWTGVHLRGEGYVQMGDLRVK